MNQTPSIGILPAVPVPERLDLVAGPVAKAASGERWSGRLHVAEIDPELADTAAFCETYEVPLEISANCVVIAGKRGGETTYAACMVLATTRADVNGVIRKHLGVRKASFAPMDTAVSLTGMEYGGITPIGLPDDWPILVDRQVVEAGDVVIGSGVRRSKLLVPGAALAELPTAETLDLTLPTG